MKTKFKILHIIETSGPGGAENILLAIVKNLDPKRYEPLVVLLQEGWLYDHLVKNNIQVKIISSYHSWDLVFLHKLFKTCQEFKTDLIHSHLTDINVYSCLAGAIARVPVIATFHNEVFLPGRAARHNALKLFLVRRLAARIVMVADYLKANFKSKAKFPPEKLVTIYNGIQLEQNKFDSEIQARKKEIGIEEDEVVIGNVANLRPPKGHRYLLMAAKQLCKHTDRIKFLIIGEGKGKLKAEMDEQIEKFNLRDKLMLLGFRDDVPKLLSLFDIYVCSSISEGLSLSILEAMAAGKPVVATAVGGNPELIIHGQNGFLVPSKDPEALAQKVLILLKDRNLRESMGKKGLEIVEKKFSLKKMIENYQNLYEKLLS